MEFHGGFFTEGHGGFQYQYNFSLRILYASKVLKAFGFGLGLGFPENKKILRLEILFQEYLHLYLCNNLTYDIDESSKFYRVPDQAKTIS